MKWEIVNTEKGEELKLEVLDCGILMVNIKYIPVGMSIDDFISYIQKEGIALRYE